jgi:hypothetical protein
VPRLVPKGARRLGGPDEMIVPICAGGITLRAIAHHLASTLGTELSHETISKVVDEIQNEVLAWQRRPLEPLYLVIYLDAMEVSVPDGAHVRNKSARIRIGVDLEGVKHVLGIWVPSSEGRETLGRGVCLPGQPRHRRRPDRVLRRPDRPVRGDRGETWTQTTAQTCVVHLIRDSVRFVSFGDRKAVAKALWPDLHRRGGQGRPRRAAPPKHHSVDPQQRRRGRRHRAAPREQVETRHWGFARAVLRRQSDKLIDLYCGIDLESNCGSHTKFSDAPQTFFRRMMFTVAASSQASAAASWS